MAHSRKTGGRAVALAALALLGSSSARGEPTEVVAAAPRFYSGQEYGSESQFNPATVLVNGGFDIFRSHSYRNSLADVAWGDGLANVTANVAHPVKSLETIGVGHFVAHEVFPYRGWEARYGQFVPNYVMHTFGEGMLFRKLDEWYAARELPHPRVAAFATTVAMQLLNEVVENGDWRGANQDPLADILIFNTLGYVLFSFDPVAGFFAGPVRLNYWPGQAVLEPYGMRLTNTGESYALEVPLHLAYDARFFGYIGAEGLFGVTLPVTARDHLSVGYGFRVLELSAEDVAGARTMVPKTGSDDLELGIFWDRHESLMASLLVGTVRDYSATLNVYPGVVEVSGWTAGLFAKASRLDGFAAGLTFRGSPLGFGAGHGDDRPYAPFR